MDTSWTVRRLINWMTERFKEAQFPTPLLDAQLLLSKALGMSKIQLYMDMDKPVSEQERSILRSLTKRRLAFEPIAYITQEKYWHDLKLFVDPRVLIPRPETETLLDFVLETLGHLTQSPSLIYDFCTGSGCLAIALSRRYPEAKVVAVDISQDALDVALINAQSHGVHGIDFVCLDLTKESSYLQLLNTYGQSQVLVSNPPYVQESHWLGLAPSVRDFEPKLALTAPYEGLWIAENIVSNALKYGLFSLEKQGVFAMELAEHQPFQLTAKIWPEMREFPLVSCQSRPYERPFSCWFSLKDYEQKARFLSFVGNGIKE